MEIESDFDFEYWAELARNDPEKFERLRKLQIDKIIQSSPEDIQKRMQGIQWQIDQIRQTTKSPMAACIKISSMMWDSVLGDNGLVEAIEKLQEPEAEQAQKLESNKTSAKVIHFPNNLDDDDNLNSQ